MTGTDPQAEVALRLGAALGIRADAGIVLPGGNQNHAVRLRRDGDADVVLRFARDPRREPTDPFEVEAWCAAAAAAAGIRTPEVVARGHVDGVSVLVHRYVEGAPARADDVAAWTAIGRVAAALAGVATADAPDALFPRFGRDLDAGWREHLDYNRGELVAADPLLDLGVYRAGSRSALIAALDRIEALRLPQGLVHGDLSTRNLLQTDDGYVVVDWGAAHAGPVPWTDLERIHRWRATADPDTTVPEAGWAAVLDGAGLGAADVLPVLRDLSAVHALDVVRWAIDRRPDRLPDLRASSAATLRRVLVPTG